MKAVLAINNPSLRLPSVTRTLLAASAVILALLSSGCYGPAKGPTNPKDFIVQGKQWTSSPPSSAPTIDPSAPATTTP